MESNVAQSDNFSLSTKSFFGRCQCGGERKPSDSRECKNIVISDPVEKPDLAIYSQLEELQNGNVPKWDNPDIVTNSLGPLTLTPEALVKIRNLSPTVPAINVLVHYFTSPFGIGTRKTHRLTKIVNVAPGAEIELNFPLDQSTLQGDPRVGVHIQIEHPHDSNAINNLGSQVIDGGLTTESGRNFSIQIPVYNDSTFSREIRLSVMPTDIIASVVPLSHVFAPYEQLNATLNIQIPDFLHGTTIADSQRAVTVVGRLAGDELIGGATRLILIDD